eukprot:UN27905
MESQRRSFERMESYFSDTAGSSNNKDGWEVVRVPEPVGEGKRLTTTTPLAELKKVDDLPKLDVEYSKSNQASEGIVTITKLKVGEEVETLEKVEDSSDFSSFEGLVDLIETKSRRLTNMIK